MSESERTQEVELKFRVSDAEQLAALREDAHLFQGYECQSREHKHVLDLYWDTADYALVRGGFGLRTRWQDGAWRITLKAMQPISSSGLAERAELEREADAVVRASLQRDHPLLGDLLAPLQQGAWPPRNWQHVVLQDTEKPATRVRPFVLLQQQRYKQMLVTDGDGLIEVSFDTIQIHAPAREVARALAAPDSDLTAASAPAATLYELEMEARGERAEAHLSPLAQALAQTHALSSAQMGKAERALRLLWRWLPGETSNPPLIRPEMAMSEAGRLIWRQQLAEALLAEAGVRRDDDVDAVHALCSAMRRMRAAAHIFGDFGQQKRVRQLREGLRTTAKALGLVRDLDVSLQVLQRYRAERGGQDHDELEAPTLHWRSERREAHAAAVVWLRSRDYSDLVTRLQRFCHTAEVGARRFQPSGQRPEQVRHVMPAQIFEGYGSMCAYERVPFPQTSVSVLHALRVEVTRLRDSLEFIQHLLTADVADLLRALGAIDDALGTIGMAAAIQAQLRSLAAAGLASPALRRYEHYQDELIRREYETFATLWSSFVAPETRQRLAQTLAIL